MPRRRIAPVIALAAVVVLIVVLLLMRGSLSKRVYWRTGTEIEQRLDPKLAERYGEELRYTLDKFWSCYEEGIVSRNDLNEVMDRMRLVLARDTIEDEDVFNLIGLVSRIYTDKLREHHDRELKDEE
jgi:tRNA C32,U32 (ribose-2'-O)-methylase TrmJ